MKLTPTQLRKMIKEEKARLFSEVTPGTAGIAGEGGGDPASQGAWAVQRDTYDAETTAGIFDADYLYDLLYDELADYQPTLSSVTTEEFARLEEAMTGALQRLKKDYVR
jgi:hypothetical protein